MTTHITEQNSNRSILATPYRNPRHEAEAAELAEFDKANGIENPQGQSGSPQPEQKHDYEKRYRDLQSYHSRTLNDLKAQIKVLQEQKAPSLDVPKSPEELAALKEKNPELFSLVNVLVAEGIREKTAQYDTNLAEVSNQLQDSKRSAAQDELARVHPDYKQIAESNEFHDWVTVQPEHIKAMVYGNEDPQVAATALSLYKQATGYGSQKHATAGFAQDGADVAVNVQTGNVDVGSVERGHPAYVWKESEIEQMHHREYEKWDDEIMLAQSEGRIKFGE